MSLKLNIKRTERTPEFVTDSQIATYQSQIEIAIKMATDKREDREVIFAGLENNHEGIADNSMATIWLQDEAFKKDAEPSTIQTILKIFAELSDYIDNPWPVVVVIAENLKEGQSWEN